ncbi:MAG: hypothetical protein H6728_13815 [Myxococcales bacterium]|nr:hypothetical protein [Myxococcales bacterium]
MWEIEKGLLRACERLIQRGLLEESAFLAARTIQEVNGEDLGLILERMGVVSSESLQHALSEEWECRFLSDEQVMLMWEEGAISPPRDIPLSWMKQDSFVPLQLSQGTLSTLVWRPLSETSQTRLCQAAKCAHLEYVLVSSTVIKSVLERLEPGKEELSMTSGELDALVPPPSSSRVPSMLQIGSAGLSSAPFTPRSTQAVPTLQPISSDDLLPSQRASLLDFIDQDALSPKPEGHSSSSFEELVGSPEVLSGDDLPNSKPSDPSLTPPRSEVSLRSPSSESHRSLRQEADFAAGDSVALSRSASPIPRHAEKATKPPPSAVVVSPLEELNLLVSQPIPAQEQASLATMSLDTIARRGTPLNPTDFLEEGREKPSSQKKVAEKSGGAIAQAPTSQEEKQKSGGALVIGKDPKRTDMSASLASVSSVVVDPSALLPRGVTAPVEPFDGRGQAQAWMRAEQVASSSDALDVIGSSGNLSGWGISNTPESLDSLDAVPPVSGDGNDSAEVSKTAEPSLEEKVRNAPEMFVEDEPTNIEDEALLSKAILEKMVEAAEEEKRRSSPSISVETVAPAPPSGSGSQKNFPATLRTGEMKAFPAVSRTPSEEEDPTEAARDTLADPVPLMRRGRDYRTVPVGVVPSLLADLEQEEPSFALFERSPVQEESPSKAKLPSRGRLTPKEPRGDLSPADLPRLDAPRARKSEEASLSQARSSQTHAKKKSEPPHLVSRVLLGLLLVVALSFSLWFFLLREKQATSSFPEEQAPRSQKQTTPAAKPKEDAKTNPPSKRESLPVNSKKNGASKPKKRTDSSDGLWYWDAKKGKLVPQR